MKNSTIKKNDLITYVSEQADITKKEAKCIVDAIFENMIEALSNGKTIDINGFGKFEIVERAARQGMNPATKEKIEIPASKAVKFKAHKVLKESVQ